jgi:hypothetical protein
VQIQFLDTHPIPIDGGRRAAALDRAQSHPNSFIRACTCAA